MSVAFQTAFDPATGEPVPVAPNVVRVTAPNPGPFTFHGTNTYLVGTERLAVVDPGPDDDRHLAALLAAIAGRPVDAILLTHAHLDHTGLVARLQAATGAPSLAGAPAPVPRSLANGRAATDAADDRRFAPDRVLGDGETVALPAGRFAAVATPGHASGHMAFALEGDGLLFSGDHVMAWSTTVVAPPDGSMTDYMASLETLLGRDDRRYLPGHGGPVENPKPFVRALRAHRRMREGAILDRLAKGDRSIPEMVAAIYRTTDPRLHGAAGMSILAHLEDLVRRDLVRTDGLARLGGRFRPA